MMKIESTASMDMQAALALNNVGVSLLERGCYRQGMEVLQDGISVLKELFGSSENKNDHANKTDIGTKLQKASDKMMMMMPHAAIAFNVATSPATPSIHTISYQVNGFVEILSCVGVSPSSSKCYLVRMDSPLEHAGFGVSNVPDMESAVLLYNLGMAQLLLSRVVSTCNVSIMLENAHRILHLASCIVARRSSTCADTLEETCMLQMGLLILHGIFQVLVECNMDHEAKTVYERYLQVREIVGNLQHRIEWYSSLLIAAPAA
ncbi:hypothetical protein MPSEU_001104300 [Mayamaea pseudoterrestris]|nr:hypothetical protein MPSEU_001104300 [Mayamaea pseudoterrestris]